MKKNVCLICFIVSLVFLGCSKKELNYTVSEIDGIKVYSSRNEPSEKDLKITLNEILTIEGFEEGANGERIFAIPAGLSADKDNNIYILDAGSKSVKKFDKTGKFVMSFCRQGIGPGEARLVSALNIIKDTILVVDYQSLKTIKFDLEGNHIRDTTFGGNRSPLFFTPFDEKNSLGLVWYEAFEDEEYHVSASLSIIDDKFKEIKVLDTQKKKFVKGNFNVADLLGSYAVSDSRLFVNFPSADKFYISVYDFSGNVQYGISKSYRRLMMSDKEVAEFNEGIKNSFGVELSAVQIPKRSINGMYYDKHGRLWVLTATERNQKNENIFYADIFKDGVYLNTIEIPQLKGSDFFDMNRKIYFIGEFIYLVDMINNEIKVFEY